MMTRIILAFDFGIHSIGVAIGQRITCTASPLSAIKTQRGALDWMLIEHLFNEWKPDEIVVGLPLNMDGSEQPLAIHTRKFASKIQMRSGRMVKLHDERLTTAESRTILFELGGYRALSKSNIDSTSAVIILESYLRSGILIS